MRPTPAELVSHVRRVLRDLIEPELDSEYARARVREIRAVLAQLDFDNVGVLLVRNTTTLRELLLDCRSWIAEDDRRATHFQPVFEELADLPAETPADFSGHNDLHAHYSRLVIKLIDPIEDWLDITPDDSGARNLRRRLLVSTAD